MGFDKHFQQDHCYLDDPADGVGMNVEIIDDNLQTSQNNIITQKVIRCLDISGSSHSKMTVRCEDSNKHPKKALPFLPYSEYCSDHQGLFLHEDEKLVKPGDKFASHDDFVQYLNENAKRWCFYYRCSDSRKPSTGFETYTYNCVYLRNKEKYKKKGLRKRSNNMKTDCPCKIKLRHLPNERELTVVYVCNHHDHELSVEEFYKLQHGRRLPPYVKEEIKDFLQLKVDIMKIKAYVEMETGFAMSRPFFYALEKNLKNRDVKRHISEQRLMLLKQKLAAVDEMFGYDDEKGDEHNIQNYDDDNKDVLKRIKYRSSLKNYEKPRKNTPAKRRPKPTDQMTSPVHTKRIKMQEDTETSFSNETLQSVKELQDSVKCEIQRNPWITDQCVPVLPNRTKNEQDESIHIETVEQLHELLAQSDMANLNYTIEYCDDNSQEIISSEFGGILDDSRVNDSQDNESLVNDGQDSTSQDNDGQVDETEETVVDNIAYETVVTDDIEDTQNLGHEYVEHDQVLDDAVEIQIVPQYVDYETGIVNDGLDSTQDTVGDENQVEYVTEENGHLGEVEYLENEMNEDGSAQDVGVQTAEEGSSAHSLLPVFDVYMKDGNVTGFVVNDNLISGLKDGVDKEIQTSENVAASETQDTGNADCDIEIIHDLTNSKHGNIYTKHEYVHKYNIDQYMVQPHFPKYIETLAKETYMDVLHMFTNIYNEKAMFKITTTHKGKEGNTRIWYIKDGHRTKRPRHNETHKEKLGQNLQSIFILKEKLRYMKKKNSELIAKNKQLEEVVLRLATAVSD